RAAGRFQHAPRRRGRLRQPALGRAVPVRAVRELERQPQPVPEHRELEAGAGDAGGPADPRRGRRRRARDVALQPALLPAADRAAEGHRAQPRGLCRARRGALEGPRAPGPVLVEAESADGGVPRLRGCHRAGRGPRRARRHRPALVREARLWIRHLRNGNVLTTGRPCRPGTGETGMDRRRFLTTSLGAAGWGAVAWGPPAAAAGPLERTFEDARPLDLRITDLKTFLVDAGNDENFVFVKLYTNQGITGLGEGTLANKGATVAAAIEEHKRYLVGRDPTEIERLWRGMFIGPRYRGGPVLMSALSAVEIALWDILGQALGQPIWQLLGGKARDKVRLYCHEGYLERISHRKKRRARSPEEEIDLWRQKKEQGWTCVKGGFYPTGNPADHRKAIREGVEHLAKVREAVGPDFDIIVEVHGKATPLTAVEFCNRVEEFRPFWVEEVTQLEDEVPGELRQVRAQTRVPLATGERLTSRWHFAPLCAERLVDVVMPDVVHVGG